MNLAKVLNINEYIIYIYNYKILNIVINTNFNKKNA